MHFACVVGKICEPFNPSTVQVWRIRMSSFGSDCNLWDAPVELWEQLLPLVPDLESAWHGCGVKTNRTKTAPMDISNIGCWLTF